MMTTTLVTLPNYQITEKIYEGSRTVVYRGQDIENERPVVIKLMRSEYPSFRELVQFRNQYAITKNIEIEGIIQSIALERYENRYALIMKDTGGISLAKYKEQSSLSLSLQQFLNIAIQIAEILHQLHNNSIIHKDIKPANILIHPNTNQIKLIDFSISSLLPKETQTLQTPNILEGTLSYLSPEQTGRMNRGIDYRSDFYSLGVTFYELLAGKLPFNSDDPLELIHAHIAQNPDSINQCIGLGEDACPQPLSDIVMKLMAKNAEDRYQSALGLKYDLEKCLAQYEETENIKPFELGERDIRDRFNIPEKLYGREEEVTTLLDAFERVATGNSEMMLVAGFSGIGKTAVVNEVHKPIVRQRGYFIKGKFDQFNRNIPFSAFVQAFRNLIGQILSESDAELTHWKTQILEAVENSGQVLIDVIPELETVIGSQPPASELSGSAAQNRFNLLFEKFTTVFTTKEHPLVIFLDDLQWADSASLNLMKVLMNESESGYLLVLGAYRDNEVFPAHPLMLTVDELEKQKVSLHTLTLNPLSQTDINQLVADTLECASEVAQPLCELTYHKTKGNPFFTTQFLQGLYSDGHITFNLDDRYWQCNLTQVRQLALTDDVVEFMATQLRKFPTQTQDILKIAACIGHQFDLVTLSVVCKQPQDTVAIDLWPSLQAGLVIPEGETYKFFQKEDIATKLERSPTVSYRFLHDRVQQAAYRLIPDLDKQKTHYQIGKLLQQATTPTDREKKIFDVVNHLNYGIDLVTDGTERQQLVELNWLACQKAKGNTAYTAAHQYVTTALQLLEPTGWQDRYNLSLSLNNTLAELNLLIGDFAAMDEAIETILLQSQSLLDRITAYRIRIQKYFFQNKLETAISIGIEVLQKLGIDISSEPTEAEINRFIQRGRESTQGISIPDLLDLPEMKDPERLAIAEIATNILSPSNMVNPPLFPILVSLLVDLSVCYGNIANSAYIYGCYGVIACNFFKEIEMGVALGRLAADLDRHPVTKTLKGRGMMMCGTFLEHRHAHLKNTLEILSVGYQMSLEVGDVEFVGHNAQMYCFNAFWSGYPLHSLQKETDAYISVLSNANQALQESYTRPIGQVCSNLLGRVEQPWVLIGKTLDESEWVKHLIANREIGGLSFFHLYKIFLCFLFEELLLASDHVAKIQEYVSGLGGFVLEAEYYFYSSLVMLATISPDSQEESLDRVTKNQIQLRDYWAKYAPMNHQHKVDLVEAEKSRVLGRNYEAGDYYDRAISGAKENEYIQEEALANELAAKFYLDWGKEKFATLYMQEAYYCYAQWGAKAKTDALEQRYPELLKPILHRAPQSSSLSSTSLSTATSHSQTAAITNISSLLNFSSLLKASQTLSGEIELDRLLSNLMKIILENAGATKGALLLIGEQGLTVDAIATRQNEDLQLDSAHQSIPLENYQDLPSGLINTVRRTQETALLDAKVAQTQFATDPYLQSFSPQSLLCFPLLERGNLIGILYLENSLTADAFTRDRIELLDALCAQAAISLSNARLYQKAQQALQDLQAAQLQLVQNEKMATLGNLVAGVAHEINNPVGFIGGNVSVAQEHLQDLLDALSLYSENTTPPESVVEELENLDLDFIAEDFPKLITSMQKGVKRIANISTSLRTFSRTDTDAKTEFNLHEGLDSTLLILKYRLKANDNRPAIEIVKEYGNIPEVKCYAGQLNQVFMNLIANGIDALEESNREKTFKDIEKEPNRITIVTELSEDQQNILVRIADNGKGMPEEVREKIFEQGFTTKGVGKGTGLGLAIAHQIITEKHGGTIICTSELGQVTTFTLALPIMLKPGLC
ncbi:trifunctional serine/threonine-protein kinase/ATP-binding protein/sensor histidine kinase [Lusitaniella coriacea]|uniref:trifunctional serine/threonine-protein kinase/ATP-binding protein/sensor histidine kinase n=1 Tax=Lusitaniella coriacea TaxID=1983105 RepID=UPI003CF5051A